ncbi:MAG: hypothetical protein II375_01195 [Bacteroidales bacterium]|nr:hypothetical protein [Bacteroidales bacterium]
MNKDTLYAAIDGQAKISSQTVEQLAATLRQFPYFHAGWILLAKGLRQANSPHFQTSLRQAAVHVWDRAALYWFLHDRYDKLPTPKVPKTKPQAQQKQTSKPADHKPRLVKPLSPALEQLPTRDIPAIADELDYEAPAQHTESYNIEDLGSHLCRPDERYSFSHWLEYTCHLQNATAADNLPRARGMDLIDKFLGEDDDHIIPAADRKPVNDAKKIEEESTRENDDILTETLASIYLKQKQYAKAIAIFKKLSLKYPEKSGYFAARISDIEKIKS